MNMTNYIDTRFYLKYSAYNDFETFYVSEVEIYTGETLRLCVNIMISNIVSRCIRIQEFNNVAL